MEPYQELVRQAVRDDPEFRRAVFSGLARGGEASWRRVTVRPVQLRGQRHLQFSYLDQRQDVTKNCAGEEAWEKLDALLSMPFRSIHVYAGEQHVQIQITKRGKALVHRHDAPTEQAPLTLVHDRQKSLLLPVGAPDPFLVTIGVMDAQGRVRPRMRSKFRQINEFLRLVMQAGPADLDSRLLEIVDCGCGNAYLSFAVYHYLNHVVKKPARLTGIDVTQELIARRAQQSHDLGWTDLRFLTSRIIDYQPENRPDIVLALHACDTATDEALAQAVRWGSQLAFSVPCCHHNLQQQLDQRTAPVSLRPVFEHGILKERMGDLFTDTFRSLILRMLGYRTEVIQFVSPEHTDKNLMIRARFQGAGDDKAVQAYHELRQYLDVTPFLEQLLHDELADMV